MTNKETADKIKISNDIQEITDVLNNPFGFDRKKAIQIIGKHHISDWNIKIADIILNINYDTLQYADHNQIRQYLWIINIYLYAKLLNETK
ncbi:MAG: hypothetical protein IJC99_02530 [Clostridia bacterium]|nr:hypothetical protein [Clostridia bacterium]